MSIMYYISSQFLVENDFFCSISRLNRKKKRKTERNYFVEIYEAFYAESFEVNSSDTFIFFLQFWKSRMEIQDETICHSQ